MTQCTSSFPLSGITRTTCLNVTANRDNRKFDLGSMVLLLMMLPAVVMHIHRNMVDNMQGAFSLIMGLHLEIKTLWAAHKRKAGGSVGGGSDNSSSRKSDKAYVSLHGEYAYEGLLKRSQNHALPELHRF